MDFRGASAEAMTTLADDLKVAVEGSVAAAAATADALFEVSQAFRREAALRRYATDVAVPVEGRQGLVTELLEGKVDEVTLRLATSAVALRWTRSIDLPDALEHLSEIAAVRSAGSEGERLAGELFTVQQAVQDSEGLRDALTDPARSVEDKAGVIDSLLAGKALPATLTLAKQSLAGTYRTVSVALAEYQKTAAAVQGEGVATVRVARPLSEPESERLADALSRQYGRPVHVNVVVDPEVLGGVRVEIGDHVIDGTVSSRLDDARRALAG